MTTAKTFIVTGASGFIGGNLIKGLCKNYPNYTIIGVGRSACPESLKSLKNFDFITLDLLAGNLQKRLPGTVEAILHFAGDRRSFVASVDRTNQFRSNVLITSELADFALLAKASRFLFASSVYVYSGCTNTPFQEKMAKFPSENLGMSKLCAESVLHARSCVGDFQSTAFRIFTTYGVGAGADQFISIARKKLLDNTPTAIFRNPEIRRDFIYIDDVVDAVLKSLQIGHNEFSPNDVHALNIGSGKATSIGDAVKLLASVLKATKPIQFEDDAISVRSGDNCHEADLTNIRQFLAWEPKVSLEMGLKKLVCGLNDE